MSLKQKFRASKLIKITLIQLIIIDVMLIVFFIKEINIKSASAAITQRKSAVSVSNMKNQGLNASQTKIPYLPSKDLLENLPINVLAQTVKRKYAVRSNSTGRSPILKLNAGLEFDPLKELVNKLGLDGDRKGELKIGNALDPYGIITEKAFIATTYDLSFASCGKYPSNPLYGITFSGKRAVKGRTIAVDPGVIPLGSDVFIEFPPPYKRLDGWYIAEDTGSKVKGNIIDVFLGESAFYEMEKFGSRIVKAKVYPLKK